MRPPRIAILAFFFGACLFILCRAITSATRPSPVSVASPLPVTQKSGRISSYFTFSAPFILFPPNAIITIADDNSTSFAARPAAFGPPLPSQGLTGQLWIGSGFTEETLQDGEGEGERGCSDAPNWDDSSNTVVTPLSPHPRDGSHPGIASGSNPASKARDQPQSGNPKGPLVDRVPSSSHSKPKSPPIPLDDGTDDYLHQGLGGQPAKLTQSDAFGLPGTGHADIQSIQEGAEIAGKIVLLSRGGCGFLEKVKWAQRRGAIALIVGDNQRGGPLIQMFAKGDTSNVTIPSIFTSRTTAYLLSLMMQSGTALENIIDEHGKPSLKSQQADKARKNKKTKDQINTGSQITIPVTGIDSKTVSPPSNDRTSSGTPSWFSGLFSWRTTSTTTDASSRPPSSGRLDWEVVEEFSDEKDQLIQASLEKASGGTLESASQSNAQRAAPDTFRIGVHDWRDPDLIESGSAVEHTEDLINLATGVLPKTDPALDKASNSGARDAKTKPQDPNIPKGGSITPGSGEYIANNLPPKDSDAIGKTKDRVPSVRERPGGLISKLFGSHESSVTQGEILPIPITPPMTEKPVTGPGKPPSDHDGLWVVITPSSGASPFFDTLLVLVISPLITLTVVYALLIIRARIRRRRWRAPKSVVERLPVRTYHTVASTPSQGSRLPSPTSSSPTTPLLQSQQESIRPRPRSRTTTGVLTADDLLQAESAVTQANSTPSRAEHEKRDSEWKKYMGRQVECVVCLEEYVDGISQVMSLPCGHEFHVDCITPWLTTRRRTCPICKGDVVRSLARGSPSSPRYEPYQDDSDEDDISAQSSITDSGARRDDDSDVERGLNSLGNSNQESWLGMLSNALRLGSSTRRENEPQEDRDR